MWAEKIRWICLYGALSATMGIRCYQGYDYNKNMELQGYPDENDSGFERNYTCPAAYDACVSVTYSTTKRRQQLSVKYSTCGVQRLCSWENLGPWCQNMPWYFQASDHFRSCNATCCYEDNCNDESTFYVWVLDAASGNCPRIFISFLVVFNIAAFVV